MNDMHLMGIEMNNICGMPSTDPRGGRATSVVADVTCRACLAALLGAIGETAEIRHLSDVPAKRKDRQ